MNFSCDMAGDLLPLYLDDSLSADSRSVLEEHLEKCPKCRASLERMGRTLDKTAKTVPPEPTASPLADYARRVGKRRARLFALAAAVILVSALLLTLCGLAVADMCRQANPHVFTVEEGIFNLTAGDLSVAAEDVPGYIFYTNSQMIQVSVQADRKLEGRVLLFSMENESSFIQVAEVSGKEAVCAFTNLTAAKRYSVICEGLDGAAVTISEGRTVSFWNSLGRVVAELTGR